MLFWENCEPSPEQFREINEIEKIIKKSRYKTMVTDQDNLSNIPGSQESSFKNQKMNPISETFHTLTEVEQTCSTFINKLDEILLILDDISTSHEEITSRTNVLMMNCEALLEQQHTLNEIVESLKNIIQPFNDVEEIAGRLGIPVDASGKPSKSLDQSSSVDPRSPEFREIILRVSNAITSLHQHPEIKDNERYMIWLLQVQKRADSLVGKTMLDLINNAKKICKEEFSKKEHSKVLRKAIDTAEDLGGIQDTPMESLSIYTKFRSLGFRMRELYEMLKFSESSTESLQLSAESLEARDKRTSSNHERKAFSSVDFEGNQRLLSLSNINSEKSVLNEVLQSYRVIRSELLHPVLEEYLKNLTNEAFPQANAPQQKQLTSHSISALCNVIRNSYAVLFRTSQLEQQLYLSLYRSTKTVIQPTQIHRGLSSSDANDESSHHPSPYSVNLDSIDLEHSQQLVEIISEISSQISGHLRSLIIKESSVESLCRVIHTLSQDVISQLEGTRLHQDIYQRLDEHLSRTTSDARERLVYCSEVTLRQQVQIFEPLPSQLQYPEIIERAKANQSLDQSNEAGVMSATWYPPLKQTLALLSLLYGTVSPPIFEDIARRSISLCIQSLTSGASGVRRWKNQLHGDLFLTRHLLILREQLIPFNMNLQSVEKQLDFSTTGTALSSIVSNSMRFLRFDSSNTFLQIARDGLPGMNELHLDIKKHLDETLKSSCHSLKYSSVQFLLGPLEAFLAKVTAFLGSDIPIYRGNAGPSSSTTDDRDDHTSSTTLSGEDALIPSHLCENLKKQQFIKYDRVHSLLTSVLQSCLELKPQYALLIKTYIDNPITRIVILKPILYELNIIKLRMVE